MHVNTSHGEFDYGLKGNEVSSNFDTEKYVCMAYQNWAGQLLVQVIGRYWSDWLKKVDAALWLRNWVRSPLLHQTVNPNQLFEGANVDWSFLNLKPGTDCIALEIFLTAVWGFGLDKWLSVDAEGSRFMKCTKGFNKLKGIQTSKMGPKCSDAAVQIFSLQGVHSPNDTRTYMWDDALYRGCGLLIPVEYGDLDRWLEELIHIAK